MHLPCVKICNISKLTESSFHLNLITFEFHLFRPKRFLRLWYVWRKPCTFLAPTLTLRHDPRNLGVPSGASKMISDPMVHLVQTKHLSCTDANTISKQTKTRFHMIHVTQEFYRVCPKRLPSIWFVRRKPCSYFASALALSPNGPNQAST